jgi:hypothetical protein
MAMANVAATEASTFSVSAGQAFRLIHSS